MRFPLTSLVRLVVLVGVVSTLAAIELVRVVPGSRVVRIEAAHRYIGVNGTTFEPPVPGHYLLDTETGDLIFPKPVEGWLTDPTGVSSWRGGLGGFEIVGRATGGEGTDAGTPDDGSGTGSGLARVGPKWPDREATEPVITGRLCWVPGSTERFVFAAGDGKLYVENASDLGDPIGGASARPVAWDCDAPGLTMIGDVIDSGIPAMGGRLLVSLSRRPGNPGETRFGLSEIWWLKLDPEGRSILAAGRLVAPGAADEESRLPNLCVGPDGRVVLAYLARPCAEPGWHIKLARVVIGPKGGDPTVDPAGVRDLGRGFGNTLPSFSADGRSVYGIPRVQSPVKTVQRFSVPGALGASVAAR